MNHRLENDRLSITVADAGAELISIFDNVNNREILWQADETYWNRHAPILFPNVGKLNNNRYLYNGAKYESGQHGFVRDMNFTHLATSKSTIRHKLIQTEDTLRNYPFKFELNVIYTLEQNKVKVRWNVLNTGNEMMYFTIGAHPAFQVPILKNTKRSDYQLIFKERQKLEYCYIEPETGTALPDTKYEMKLHNGSCPITDHMFDKDALIFDEGQIEWAAIGYPDGTPYVGISSPGFPNFGIWSKPNAPFICLEPWMGRCDDKGFDKDISLKPGINKLKPEEMFDKGYEIIIF